MLDPCLTLKEGSKNKSDPIKRFAGHEFLYVGLTSQTSRTNNRRIFGPFGWNHFLYGTLGCLMTLNKEPQGQIFRYIKETYISVQHINYEENKPST